MKEFETIQMTLCKSRPLNNDKKKDLRRMMEFLPLAKRHYFETLLEL